MSYRQSSGRTSDDRYLAPRRRMLEGLKKSGINHKSTLDAMASIDRHLFVEAALSERAYDDYAAPIGNGQTISKPYTVALMTQLAALTGSETVLEVGTGSGYQAAVLSRMVEKLYTIERFNEFSNRARKLFNDLKIDNIVCLVGDGTKGAARYAPFDVIVVTAVGPKIPEPLALQLTDGGRMIVPVDSDGEQRIHVVRRDGKRFAVTKKEPCAFVPLVGEHGHDK